MADFCGRTSLSYSQHPVRLTHAKADLLKELKERLRFETLLADISAQFVNLPADQIYGEINKFFPDKEKGFG